MKNNKEINEDSFYCESNISYLENIHKDIEECKAHFERSDACAVEACSVVTEARIACVLADELLLKFGGDNLDEMLKK